MKSPSKFAMHTKSLEDQRNFATLSVSLNFLNFLSSIK
jgi:hypothetical protein